MNEIHEIHQNEFVAQIYIGDNGTYDFTVRHWQDKILATGHGCHTLMEARERVFFTIRRMEKELYRSERR
jgi:hypothetical protein